MILALAGRHGVYELMNVVEGIMSERYRKEIEPATMDELSEGFVQESDTVQGIKKRMALAVAESSADVLLRNTHARSVNTVCCCC